MLGIALAGLAPVVVSQLRVTAQVEARLPGSYAPGPGVTPGGTHYLVPDAHGWARKFGVDATITGADLPPADVPAGATNAVTIESVTLDGSGEIAWVQALVEDLTPP